MAVLMVESGKDKGRGLKVEPGKTVIVGREKACEFPIRDAMVSRRHFHVRMIDGGRHVVRDLRSSNGTYLNGRRLAPETDAPLEIEDKVQVGSTLFALVADETAASAGTKGELSGRTVGGYRVMERLGRGGMGTVYKALQLSLDRTVALKILARDLSSDRSRVEMFLSEARAAGKLNHPNIVQVYDVGSDQGLYFFSMEFMERGSLEDLVQKEGPLPVPRAIRVAIDAAKGLEFAERQGLVHRDVKPGNLMVNADGVTKIGDLGIARAARAAAATADLEAVGSGDGTVPLAGAGDELLAGSPLYMAPEQAKAEEVGHRADLYSLGATLFHVLAGEPPFGGASPREVIAKHVTERPRSLVEVNPAIPAELAALVARLLEKEPAARPESATVLLEDLKVLAARYPEGASAAAGGEGATPVALAAAGVTPARRRALLLLLLLLLAGTVLVALVGIGTGRAVRRRLSARAEARANEEARRLAAAEAERAARERAAAEEREGLERREIEAQAALNAADGYLRDNAHDLEGARRRYLEVATTYAGTGAETRARDQAQTIGAHLESLAEAKRKREEIEAAAAAEVRSVASAIGTAPLDEIEPIRARLGELAKKDEGLAAAAAALAEAKKALSARIEALVRALDGEIDGAVRAGDFAAADRALERAARPGLPELKGWLEAKRTAVAARELEAREAEAAALARARAAEIATIEAAQDPARLTQLQYGKVIEDLEAIKRRGLRSAEGRALVEEALFARRAEERLRQRLLLHVNKSEDPPIIFPVARGILGTAVKADDVGLTITAGKGNIEVMRPYATLTKDELARVFGALPALKPIDPFALALVYVDFGDVDRARRELDRATRDADPELLKRIEALQAKLAPKSAEKAENE